MKRILFFVLLIALNFSAKATHLMGGEIVAHYDSASSAYVITLTHYRDTMGIPLYTTNDIAVYQYNTTTSSYSLLQTLTVPLNTALGTALIPSFPYGVEVGVYTDTIALTPGQYRIVNETCCRNGAIVNMSNPLSESMTLYTDLTVDTLNNSTPGFLAMPVAYFPVNQPAVYNPLPYDPDGDSISWNLNTAISTNTYNAGAGSVTFTNVAGFVAPSAAASGPFTMNSVTGEINWTPDTVGNFVQSFEVKEYKNGVQVGTIIRDMQYVIVPGTGTSSPLFSNITPYNVNTSQGYNYIYYNPGQQLLFQIQGTDPNNNNLTMDAYSQAFLLPNPATFTVAGTGSLIAGNFLWTPPANYTQDMIVVFRLKNGQFTKDFTLLMRKNPNPSGVSNLTNGVQTINVFPNPAKNKINVSLQLDKAINGDVALYSSIGQKVKSIYTGKLMKGNMQLTDDLNLSAGMYFLVVKDNGNIIKTVSVAIQ